MIFKEYGGVDVLHPEDIKKPRPKENEVLVKVHAVSINDWDWGILQGVPFANRITAGLSRPTKIQILGSDVAGQVVSIGKKVKKFREGDKVFGDLSGRWGGFAEYVCAVEKQFVKKPEALSFVHAAALPQAGTLALQGLFDKGKLQHGQKILINGAGGGVGTLGLQLAKMYDAEVTGIDSDDKLEMMLKLGFDHVLDYRRVDFTRKGTQYDLILDTKTNRSPLDYARVIKPGGSYVTVGGMGPKVMQIFFLGPLFSFILGKKMSLVLLKINKDLEYLGGLCAAGTIVPLIDRTFPLKETPQAIQRFSEAKHQGKIVITMET